MEFDRRADEVDKILERLTAAGFSVQWTPPTHDDDPTHRIIVARDGRYWGIWSADPVLSAREILKEVGEA
ncbi:MAG: hypothetical protein AMXMBFR13_16670 [Phycisphaerae bacterium]|jgi:hypothetical protein